MLADHEDLKVGDTVYYCSMRFKCIIRCNILSINDRNLPVFGKWVLQADDDIIYVNEPGTDMYSNLEAAYDDAIRYHQQCIDRINESYLKLKNEG